VAAETPTPKARLAGVAPPSEHAGAAAAPPALRSALLAEAGAVHAFFTRQGGVSAPPFDTLNFSSTTGDEPAAVRESWVRAARVLGVSPERVLVLAQVHGVRCVVVAEDTLAAELAHEQGDAVLSRTTGLACGVRTADCAPVLLFDRRSGAAAAVHAGWRGVVAGVVPAAIRALATLVGAPLELCAAIGPHIERCCFEVSDDVAAELCAVVPTESGPAERVVVRDRAKPHVDLRAIIEAQPRAAGCAEQAVDHVRGCTMCDRARFHSYRRDGSRGGRMLAAIVPRG
jgi:YfiH family protein